MKRNLDIEIQYYLDGGDGMVELTVRENESGITISDTCYEPKNNEEKLELLLGPLPSIVQLYDRLAAYENTRLEPEEISAIKAVYGNRTNL